MSDKMTCLGECRKEFPTPNEELCWTSGKCADCCDNECGCNRLTMASESVYDNLCESKWLKSQPEAQ